MTDTEIQTQTTPQPAAQPAATAEVSAAPAQARSAENCIPAASIPQKRSLGEYIFDKGTYVGLNYFVNLAIGTGFLYFLRHTGKGNKALHWMNEKTTKLFHVTDPETVKKVHSVIQASLLVVGGTVVLFPTKYLEDNKREVVRWIEHKIGKPQMDQDGKHLNPDEINLVTEGKKQTWGNIAKRRLLSLGLVMGIDWGLNKTYGTEKLTGQIVDLTTQGAKKTVNFIGKPEWAKTAHNPTIKRILDIIALDSIFTVVSSATVRLTNGATKKEALKHNEPNYCPPEQQSQPGSSQTLIEPALSEQQERNNWQNQVKPNERPAMRDPVFANQLQLEPEPVLGQSH